MQHLHLVGFTAELDGLIFSAKRGSKSGGFVVALDDRLLDSIREAVRLQTGADVDLETEESSDDALSPVAVPELRRLGRVHSVLAPKEIQARLRAGRSVAEVADEAEVDESWILRFASPVLAEQSRIVELALQIRCRANRKGESAEPLAESVAENLIDRGTFLTPDEMSGAWSAYHVRDTSWVVRFRYISRRRAQVAQWAYDQSDSTVVPINRLATDLGYLDPARRKRRLPLPEATDARLPAAADDGVAKVTAAARPTAPRTRAKSVKRAAARKPASPTQAASRAAKRRAPGKRSATKAPAKRAPAKRTATMAATKRAATMAATKRAATKAPAKRTATTAVTKRAPAKRAGATAVTKRAPAKRAAKRAPVKRTAATAVAKRAPAKRAAAKSPTSAAPAKRTARKVGPAVRKATTATKTAVAPASPTAVGYEVVVSPDAGRRPPVSGLSRAATTAAPRRERPLVAVRATQPAPPLTERVVKVATDHAPLASTGTVVTNGGGVPLMIAAEPAGAVTDADKNSVTNADKNSVTNADKNSVTDADVNTGADRSEGSPTP